MKENKTFIAFVLDRSGSMSSIKDDIIGGFNEYIEEQKNLPGECSVSLYQFDDVYESVFENYPISQVLKITKEIYKPRNSTALYDAMGITIDNVGKLLNNLSEDERPSKVLIITITDGLNNASTKYKLSDIREKIKHQTENYNWQFVFMGSNIDSWEEGSQLGISKDSTLQFASVGDSVVRAFSSLSSGTKSYRASQCDSYSFSKEDIDAQDKFLDKSKQSK